MARSQHFIDDHDFCMAFRSFSWIMVDDFDFFLMLMHGKPFKILRILIQVTNL